jgi:hypothetical protein
MDTTDGRIWKAVASAVWKPAAVFGASRSTIVRLGLGHSAPIVSTSSVFSEVPSSFPGRFLCPPISRTITVGKLESRIPMEVQ